MDRLVDLALRTGRQVGPHISMLLASLEGAGLLPGELEAQVRAARSPRRLPLRPACGGLPPAARATAGLAGRRRAAGKAWLKGKSCMAQRAEAVAERGEPGAPLPSGGAWQPDGCWRARWRRRHGGAV